MKADGGEIRIVSLALSKKGKVTIMIGVIACGMLPPVLLQTIVIIARFYVGTAEPKHAKSSV